MPNEQLTNFIKESTKAGLSINEIRIKLLEVGWPEKDVEEALNQQSDLTEQKLASPPVIDSSLKTSLASGFTATLPNLPTQSISSPLPKEQINSLPTKQEQEYSSSQSEQNNSQNNNSGVSISIERITNPSRLLAFPLIGPLIKFILLIPIFIESFILVLIWLFLMTLNSFSILITGNYWTTFYNFNVGFAKFQAKLTFYIFGLTNKYPGFNLEINDNYSITFPSPNQPSRLMAIPFLGLMMRGMLLYPLYMFVGFIQMPAMLCFFLIAWIPILINKNYPETIFEMVRDSMLLSLRASIFLTGVDDDYPDFKISWNHRTLKYVLITLPLIIIYGFYFVFGILASLAAINPAAQIQKANDLKNGSNYLNIIPTGTLDNSYFATPTPNYQLPSSYQSTPGEVNIDNSEQPPSTNYQSPAQSTQSSLGKLVSPTTTPLDYP